MFFCLNFSLSSVSGKGFSTQFSFYLSRLASVPVSSERV